MKVLKAFTPFFMIAPMLKEKLEELYYQHHTKQNRYGYLFCSGSRIPYLKKWIGVGQKVLDLGCRDGMLTEGYAQGNQVIGVDIDKAALKLIKARLGIETVWIDLNGEWPFEKEAFDVIVACEVVEHIFFLDEILKKITSSLKKGGQFIGSVPNAFRIRNRLKFLFGKEYETDPTHVRQFSLRKLENTLGNFFQNVETVPLKGKVLPFLPVAHWMPKKISALFAKDFLWRCIK